MTTGRFTICLGCDRRSEEDGSACEAFPDGIPGEIINGGFDHREPFEGDNGLRFVQAVGLEGFTQDYEKARLAEADAEAAS